MGAALISPSFGAREIGASDVGKKKKKIARERSIRCIGNLALTPTNERTLPLCVNFAETVHGCTVFTRWLILIDRYTYTAFAENVGDLSRNCDIAIPSGETEFSIATPILYIYFCVLSWVSFGDWPNVALWRYQSFPIREHRPDRKRLSICPRCVRKPGSSFSSQSYPICQDRIMVELRELLWLNTPSNCTTDLPLGSWDSLAAYLSLRPYRKFVLRMPTHVGTLVVTDRYSEFRSDSIL